MGAEYGNGIGIQGHSYAIPTKDKHLSTLPISLIQAYVDEFVIFVRAHPEYMFLLTPIGCGLAGFKRAQIRPLFQEVEGVDNVIFLPSWYEDD